MFPPQATYPSKRVPGGGTLTTRQFVLPLRIQGSLLWGVLDTGARISVLPKELADAKLGISPVPHVGQDAFPFAQFVEVPYETREFTVDILEPDGAAIRALDFAEYEDIQKTFRIPDVEFKIPALSYPEIADRLDATAPVDIKRAPLRFAILGVYGLLEDLNVSFVSDNAVTISQHEQG